MKRLLITLFSFLIRFAYALRPLSSFTNKTREVKNTDVLEVLLFPVLVLIVSGCDEPTWEGELTAFSGSSLPVVVVRTAGKKIPDEPKIQAQMTVFEDGVAGLESLSDKSGRTGTVFSVGIENRGYTSQAFPKKQYGIEIRDESGEDVAVSLLGLPSESDWVLHAPFIDKSLIRNHFAYTLSNSIGRYAPRTVFVELFLNDDGDSNIGLEHYRGVYVLTEKIKRDKQRVAVEKLDKKDVSDMFVTGGYLLEWTQEKRIKQNEISFSAEYGEEIIVKYPKYKNINNVQENWISGYIDSFETVLQSDSSDKNNIKYFIDVDAFIDFFLLNELLRNYDVFIASTFIHKSRDGKLAMGPIWDFDRSMGDVNIDNNHKTSGWLLPKRGWGRPLFKLAWFVSRLKKRWNALRMTGLETEAMCAIIDDAVAQLGDSPERNFEKWTILGKYIHPNKAPYSTTHGEEIDKVKHWLAERALWIDEHIGSL